MRPNGKDSRFRTVEFTIGAAALAIFASAGAPTPSWERIAANQRAAISTLRSIAAAQAEFRSAVEIDTNCDGVGEYGYFAELAGTRPMRVSHSCVPGAGSSSDILSPPLLRDAFGSVSGSRVSHRGYYFQMWLPFQTTAGIVSGIQEDLSGGKSAAPFPGSVNGAEMWCCYAWPIDYARTGCRAYFINQRGVVLECQNRSAVPFDGTTNVPVFYEVYAVAGDMSSPLRTWIAGGALNTIWTPVEP
jgi:hypothetical protein